ncbi:hypothetical protein MAM1_0122c05911 [Mucor ambiguus]|uniref:DUF4211 domain-containing protein n=1 Tax=Mucor ambiguus TaxID=91626 RepID=A0A0C9MW99_9FUNG|nr:hypothetical protein MAM1_0122c05911 [Mucor ambiguus]
MTKSSGRKRQQTLMNYFKASCQEEHTEPTQHALEASTSISIETNPNQQTPEVLEKKKVPVVIIKKKRKPAIPRRNKKMPIIIDSDEEETDQDDDMDEEVIVRKTNKRRLIVESSDEEDGAEAPITITSEEAISGTVNDANMLPIIANANFGKYPDQDMLEDDMEFLDKSDILQSRTRGKRPGKYAESLKKLKDRKLKAAQYDNVDGGPMDSFISPKRPRLVILSPTEGDEDGDEDDDSSEGDSSDDEDDFIVDDDIVDGRKVEAPTVNAALPAEFSTTKSMSFKRQMDLYVQSLIELVLDPAFDISSNQKYSLANETINKRVQAYKDSMVTSDIWHPEFKIDLDKYTKWAELDNYVYDGSDVCEACRGNKPASISVRLYSDGELDFEIYNLGSECSKKAFIYHEMKHFRTHMYQKVRKLVTDRSYNDNTSQEVFENLLQKGHVRTLRQSITKLFSDVVLRYNPRGQRGGVVENDSDDSSEDEDMY